MVHRKVSNDRLPAFRDQFLEPVLGMVYGQPVAPGWVQLVYAVVGLRLVAHPLRLAVLGERLLAQVLLALDFVQLLLGLEDGIQGLRVHILLLL
jgi:hypothetical protein